MAWRLPRRAAGLVVAALLVPGLVAAAPGGAATVRHLDAILPEFESDMDDAYLCTAVELPAEPLKLVGVQALSRADVVHHILMFGCETPASSERVWHCHHQRPCGGSSETILYGWGLDADEFVLPPGVGFGVGQGTAVRTVVLQMHFLKRRPAGDRSGVRLTLTAEATPGSAGMIMFASGFSIPPGQAVVKVEDTCCLRGWEPLTAFAFRVHTHAMGRQVYLERLAAAGGGGEREVLGRRDPLLPQGFNPQQPTHVLQPGDTVRATCEFNSSDRTEAVNAGNSHNDEMCNYYQMVHSALPYFMTCSNNLGWSARRGPGGLPLAATLQADPSPSWRPPAPWDTDGPSSSQESAGKERVGQMGGVAAGANGTLWLLHRAGRTWDADTFGDDHVMTRAEPIDVDVVYQLNQDTGAVLASWGAGLFLLPHMISVDRSGNLWVVDVGLHQALHFSPDGRLLRALGQARQPGAGLDHLCKPTHVAEGPDGTLYIADGYCNTRVLVIAPGGQRSELVAPEGQAAMAVVHSLALDACADRLWVADREGARVHAFSLATRQHQGSWAVGEWGLPYAVAVGPYGQLLALVWQRDAGGAASLLLLPDTPGSAPEAVWALEGVAAPHDMALAPAPLALTGARERLLAVLLAEGAPRGAQLRKFIIVPKGSSLPAGEELMAAESSHQAQGGVAQAAAVEAAHAERLEDDQPHPALAAASSQGPVHRDAAAGARQATALDTHAHHAAIYQESSIPLSEAIGKLLATGLPVAGVFALVAVFLWRKLGDLRPLPAG